MEAAIVEQLRRADDVRLHNTLVNAALIYDEDGRSALTALYQRYIDIATEANLPFLMCTPTWRANRSRVFSSEVNRSVNADAAHFMKQLRDNRINSSSPIMIGGMIGCKNDCYLPDEGLSTKDSEGFHSWQIEQLAKEGVDFLIAETLPNVAEAIGIALAMECTRLPYILSFVIDRHGTVLDGTALIDAIRTIDSATHQGPVGYMVNCAYPAFLCAEQQPVELFSRLIGYQANASALDHCDLDNSDKLESEGLSEWGELCLI